MSTLRYGIKLASTGFSIFKKILLIFIVITTVISLFNYVIHRDKLKMDFAARKEYQSKLLQSKMHDPEISKTEGGKLYLAVGRDMICALTGETCDADIKGINTLKNHSMFGRITGLMATPYASPPASGIAWLQDSMEHSGFIPQTYASEGVGFSSIKGYLVLWKMFRNIAFMLLVILMLVIGFMIMFRVKIDAQTMISIESALPRIVITMILISFSFAIVGFLIDIMYLLIGLSVDLILGQGLGFARADVMTYQNDMVGATFRDLWPENFGLFNINGGLYGVGSAMWDLIPLSFKGILDFFIVQRLATFLAHTQISTWEPLMTMLNGVGVGGGIATVVVEANSGNTVGNLLKWVSLRAILGLLVWILPGLILALIMVLTIVLQMFKIFFILLGSYIKIILYIIFAPVIILMEAIPGQSTFSWWLKNVLGELIVFPTVIIIMLTGQAIVTIHSAPFGETLASLGSTGTNIPFTDINIIGNSQGTFVLPFLYGFNPDDFNFIVALGIILLTPDLIKIVKGWFGVQDLPLNLSLGTFLQGGSAIASGAMGGLGQFHTLQSTLVGQNPGHGLLHKWEGSGPVKSLIGALGGKTHSDH